MRQPEMCLKLRLILLPVLLASLLACAPKSRSSVDPEKPDDEACEKADADQNFDDADLECLTYDDVCGTPGWPPCQP